MNDVEKGHFRWSSRALNYIKGNYQLGKAQVIREMVTWERCNTVAMQKSETGKKPLFHAKERVTIQSDLL